MFPKHTNANLRLKFVYHDQIKMSCLYFIRSANNVMLADESQSYIECRKDIHYKTQNGTSCEKCNSKALQLGIEPASSGLLDQCSTTELQKPLPKLSATASVQKQLPKFSTEAVAQVVGNGFCSSVDAGSVPSQKALELHFPQLVPVWVL